MRTPSQSVLLGVAAAFALVAGLLAAQWWTRPAVTALASGTLLDTPRPLPPFQLLDEQGQPFGPEQLRGQWSVIFVGFTQCPDICPATLGLLAQALRALEAQRPQVLLLSVDPERDSPERLRGYVRHFDPAFRAATGSIAELEQLGQALGFVFAKVAQGESYTLDHSGALMLINPAGQLAGYITPPFSVSALAADFRLLPEHAG